MCTVSMVGDHYKDYFPKQYPTVFPDPKDVELSQLKDRIAALEAKSTADALKIQALRNDVEQMKALLQRAKQYDIDNNEPDCEIDEKVEMLKKVAEAIGVDLTEVFGDDK